MCLDMGVGQTLPFILIRILGNNIKTVSLLFGEPYMIQLIPPCPNPTTNPLWCRNMHTRWFLTELKRISACNHEGNSVTIIWQPVKNIKSCCPQQRVVLTTAAAEMSSVTPPTPPTLIDLMCGFGFFQCRFLCLFVIFYGCDIECFAFCALFFPFCVSYTREWNCGLLRVQHLKESFLCLFAEALVLNLFLLCRPLEAQKVKITASRYASEHMLLSSLLFLSHLFVCFFISGRSNFVLHLTI